MYDRLSLPRKWSDVLNWGRPPPKTENRALMLQCGRMGGVKIPSEMEVAPRYTLLTLLTMHCYIKALFLVLGGGLPQFNTYDLLLGRASLSYMPPDF